MILIYVTCKDAKEAQKISRTLLEKRLIGCANFFPINSMYWWKDSINQENEVALILKTVKEKFEDIKKEVKKIHSYDCPCVISLDVQKGNKEYLEWIKKEIKS